MPSTCYEPAVANAAELIEALTSVVGAAHVLTDPDLRAGYERDWTGKYVGSSFVVVRPGDAAEVAAVVRACSRVGASIVAQGGNTGMVGGGVLRRHEAVLSLRRLDDVGPVDGAARQVTVGAGVTLERFCRLTPARLVSTSPSSWGRDRPPPSAGWWPPTPEARVSCGSARWARRCVDCKR